MKHLLITGLLLISFAVSGFAQNVELTLRYERDTQFGDCFKVYFKSFDSYPYGFQMGPQQVTVVTPTSLNSGAQNFVVLPGGVGGGWSILGGSAATQCNDRNCYTAFAANGAPVTQEVEAGKEYLLFQFQIRDLPCTRGLRLHDVEVDPIDPDGNSDDFANSMFVIADGTGSDVYAGNYANNGTECAPSIITYPQAAGNDINLTMFPNPASDGVLIEMSYTSDETIPTEIAIFNALGQLVYSMEVPDRSISEYIDFGKTNIESGSYSVRVLDSEENIISTEKLVVQR